LFAISTTPHWSPAFLFCSDPNRALNAAPRKQVVSFGNRHSSGEPATGAPKTMNAIGNAASAIKKTFFVGDSLKKSAFLRAPPKGDP